MERSVFGWLHMNRMLVPGGFHLFTSTAVLTSVNNTRSTMGLPDIFLLAWAGETRKGRVMFVCVLVGSRISWHVRRR